MERSEIRWRRMRRSRHRGAAHPSTAATHAGMRSARLREHSRTLAQAMNPPPGVRVGRPQGYRPVSRVARTSGAALAFFDKPFYMYSLQGEQIAGEAICTIGTNGGWSWRSDYRRTRRTSRTTTGLSVLTTI